MTDITELAQRMKTAAEEALSTGGISNYRKGQLAMQKFLSQASAENILALVEALEKAQQRINEMDDRIRKQNRHVCELFDDGKALRERIDELESRTVKLPDLRQSVSGERYVWSDGVFNYSQDVKAALAAAGIKVEAE